MKVFLQKGYSSMLPTSVSAMSSLSSAPLRRKKPMTGKIHRPFIKWFLLLLLLAVLVILGFVFVIFQTASMKEEDLKITQEHGLFVNREKKRVTSETIHQTNDGSGEGSDVFVDPIKRQEKLMYKKKLCQKDFDNSNVALRLIQVTQDPTLYPRVLCFINTISVHHFTRVQAIRETWGQRCDKLVFVSNETNAALGTVAIDAPSDHDHLWQKHKASLRYIWKTYGHEFDWFYKADDDAYVVVENLKQYLRSPEIQNQMHVKPLQLGHRFYLDDNMLDYYVVDKDILKAFQERTDRWIFASGGPGYAMNRLYMQTIVSSLEEKFCLSDRFSIMLPDDSSISFCMAFHDVFPWDTRDLHRRERWHTDKPKGVYYTNPDQPNYWFIQYHQGIGGYRWREDCCAKDSIAFHYLTPDHMHHLERQFYFCRTSSVADMVEYNAFAQLNITSKVTQWPPPDPVPPPKKE